MIAVGSDLTNFSKWRLMFMAGAIYFVAAPWILKLVVSPVVSIQMSISDAVYHSCLWGVLIPTLLLSLYLSVTRRPTEFSVKTRSPANYMGFSGILVGLVGYFIWQLISEYYGLLNQQDTRAFGLCVFLSAALVTHALFFKGQS